MLSLNRKMDISLEMDFSRARTHTYYLLKPIRPMIIIYICHMKKNMPTKTTQMISLRAFRILEETPMPLH